MKQYDAVIAGYTCVDLIPTFPTREPSSANLSGLLKPGKLIEIDGLQAVLGGLVPNTGLAMKKFDRKVFLNGLVGDDVIGGIAKELFGKCGVSEGIQTTRAAGTACSIVIAPPGIDRIFLESPGCNRIYGASHVNFDAVSQCRVFHFGYPPLLRRFFLDGGSELSSIFARVQQMGVTTSLDFSLPDPESESGKADWLEILRKTLPFTDIFVPSVDELMQIMTPPSSAGTQCPSDNIDSIRDIPLHLIRDIGRRIIDFGVKILLIKAGARGAFLLTGDVSSISDKLGIDLPEKNWNYQELWCDACQADRSRVVNASGAGDTAAAGFLSAILGGECAESALKYAVVAGRNNLYCHDLYNDLSNWLTMTEDISSEPIKIVHWQRVKT
jgi:sugar/nucleoside kinase (ribokinase family)